MTMEQDKLVDLIYKKLNKNLGKTNPIYKLNDDLALTKVKQFVPTGCAPLDVALANRKDGGFAVGRISEIRGDQSAGKSLLLATTLAKAQEKNWYTALFDTEFAADPMFCKAIGLDMDKLVYGNIEYVEEVLQSIEDMVILAREKGITTPIVIGVDSIAGLKTKLDAESGYDKDGYNTSKAIILSQKLPKILSLISKNNVALIFTQQFRANMNAGSFGPKKVSASGGKAVGFYISQRVDLSSIGSIKADNLIVGRRTRAKVVKNRLGPPFREAEFEIFFDSGIDDFKSCLDILSYYKIVEGKQWKNFAEDLQIPGIELNLVEEKGKKSFLGPKFQMAKWREWMENPETYKAVVDLIAECNVMKYKGYMNSDNTTLELDNPDDNNEETD